MTALTRNDHRPSPGPHATVAEVMTPSPHTIERTTTVARAFALMRQLRCHHLPVLDGGVIVGVVSARELFFVEGAPDAEMMLDEVSCAMSTNVFTTASAASAREVAAAMAHEKCDVAIVTDGGVVIGIFTATDALRYLHAFPC